MASLDICCGLSVREWGQGQDNYGAQKHVVDLYHNQVELHSTINLHGRPEEAPWVRIRSSAIILFE